MEEAASADYKSSAMMESFPRNARTDFRDFDETKKGELDSG